MSEPEYKPLPPWPWKDGTPLGEMAQTRSDFRIGTWALIHDVNRRVYPERVDGNRNISGRMSPRHCFRPVEITGETSRSWVLGKNGCNGKLAKKSDNISLYSITDVEAYLWINLHRHHLSTIIRVCNDIEILKGIAELVGYREGDPRP